MKFDLARMTGGMVRLEVLWLVGVGLMAVPARAAPADDLLARLRPGADVNDFADVLSAEEERALEQRCEALRSQTGAQLAVVTLPSLEGGQIDDFSEKLFRRWGIGEAGRDNGVLLLVAIGDRQARIEVGYGLEPIIPDILAGRILREELFPRFRQQQYFAGLRQSVNRISGLIEQGEPARAADLEAPENGAPGWLMLLMFLGFFTFMPSFGVGQSLRQKQFGAAATSGLFVGFLYLLGTVVGLAAGGYLLLLAIDVVAAWLGYNTDPTQISRQRRARRDEGWFWGPTYGGGSGWSGGGFGGGGGGGWGGFGGGHSGGGGASGGW